jgi:hypoxanthine phosphoribosyltransferase
MGSSTPEKSFRPAEAISADRIRGRIGVLAGLIRRDYVGRELTIVGVLNGAFVFTADLVRALERPCEIDFIRVASYGPETESSGVVEIRKDVESPLVDRHVLIVEDVVDTGLTASFLKRHVAVRRPASVAMCALLDKPSRRKVEIEIEYVGFSIDDRFVVGYGLDHQERFRELPYVAYLD